MIRGRVLTLAFAALACALLLAAPPALAQPADPPAARRLRLIVPFAPGGSADTLARMLAEPLGRRLGQTVAVENRAGAGGLIAGEACARAAPDGLTLCMGSAATHSVLPLQMPGRVGADATGFTPITRIGDEATILAVGHAHPAADLPGLLDWARRQPQLAFGVGGASSAGTLMMLRLAQATGLRLEPVFYRGGGLTQTAVITGEVPVGVGLVSSFLGALRSGEMRPILILGPARSAILPGVPAIGEALLPGAGVTSYTGVFGPADLPPPLAARIHAAIAETVQAPSLRARAEALGVEIGLLGPAEFAAWLRASTPVWAELLALSTQHNPMPEPRSPSP